MPKINLLGSATTGRSTKATAQRRKNFYLDVPPGGGDAAAVVAYPTPGLESKFSSLFGVDITHVYGMHWYPDISALVFAVSLANTATGAFFIDYTLTFQRSVVFSILWPRVNFVSYGNQLLVATGTDAICIDASSYPSSLTDTSVASFIVSRPHWCAYLGGRFILPWDDYPGRFAYSDINDCSAAGWDALNYFTAESSSDALVYGLAWRGILVLFGLRTTEFWQPTGDNAAPFSLIVGSVGNYGCVSDMGAQIVGNDLIFVARMPQGTMSICKLNGYEAQPISTPDIDHLLTTYNYVTASAAYQVNGHSFFEVTLTNSGSVASRTFLYDATSGVWSDKESPDGSGYSQITCAAPFIDGDARPALYAGTRHGRVCQVLDSVYTEPNSSGTDTAIDREIVMPHFFDVTDYNRVRLSRFRCEVGRTSATAATAKLYISRDGGETYGDPIELNLPDSASPMHFLEARRLGMARDWVFKLVFDDAPEDVVLLNAWIDADEANR